MGIFLDGKAMLKQITEESPSATDISMAKYIQNRLLLVERAKWNWSDRFQCAILSVLGGALALVIIMAITARWGIDWWSTKKMICGAVIIIVLLIAAIYALIKRWQTSIYRRSNKEIDDLAQQLDEAIEAACGGPVDDGNDADQIQEILDSYLR